MATHVVISGRVQGVGYRAWTADEAIARGLTGWVRNRRDGSVEAMFAGDEEDVAEMVAACRHGPPLARVVNVVANTAHGDLIAVSGEEAFAMLPTI